jgi:hypothetical protein
MGGSDTVRALLVPENPESVMPLAIRKVIDISLELDDSKFSEHGIVTMPYLNNLDEITEQRVTLIALPLKLMGAEASPVRAVVLMG